MGALTTLLLRALLFLSAVLIIGYFILRINLVTLSPYLVVFSTFLVIAEAYTVIHFLSAMYAFWPRKYKVYKKINYNKHLKIHMLICVCGEPPELVRNTIIAAKKAANQYAKKIYPITLPRVVVLNDGYAAKKANCHDIKRLCNELGVMHIARKTNAGFKAGNINNALQKLSTKDPTIR